MFVLYLSPVITLLGLVIVTLLKGQIYPTQLILVLYASGIQGYLAIQDKILTLVNSFGRPRYVPKYKYLGNKLISSLLIVTPFLLFLPTHFPIIFLAIITLLRLKEIVTIFYSIVSFRRYKQNEKKWLNEFHPLIGLHNSGKEDAAYQTNMWLPVIEELDQKAIVVLREYDMLAGMINSKLPVVMARTQEELEQVINSGIKILLYPSNPIKNIHAMRHFAVKHYFINHGESDKALNQNKFMLAYDKILLAGPLGKQRLIDAGLPVQESQIAFVGRPQTEIFLKPKEHDSNRITDVFYAPTHEGPNLALDYSSVSDFGLRLLNILFAEKLYELSYKPHPFTGRRCKNNKKHLKLTKRYCLANKLRLAGDKDNIYHLMNESDLLITDVSSMLNEYLLTKKPIILCNVMGKPKEELHREFPSSRAAYILNEPDQIIDLIKVIEKNDPLKKTREEVRKYSMGDFPEGSLERFKKTIDEGLTAG